MRCRACGHIEEIEVLQLPSGKWEFRCECRGEMWHYSEAVQKVVDKQNEKLYNM